jgi:hypothetical protein
MSDDRFDVLERLAPLFEAPEPSFEGFLRRRDRKRRNQRITAGVVAIAVVVAPVWIVVTGGRSDRTQTPAATAPPTPERVDFIGLPPEGATPSIPERGELVLRLDGSTGGPGSMIWVYADGRLIWSRQAYVPEDGNEPSTGLLEQRLTPEGVEFLRSQIIWTGLFEHDLAIARRRDEPGLSIQVRNGDRFVSVDWAWWVNFYIRGAPFATPEQADALEQLDALLTDPASWPASAWEDRQIKDYVPSRYSVCFRGIPEPIEPSRILTLLPGSARDLLRAGIRTQQEAMPANGDCYGVTTEDARALAEIFDDAGIGRYEPPARESWLRYDLEDPGPPGNQVWITFGPVLPHGEATWLGPG